MRIEAIITCVRYADFLEHTLPDNLNHLDRIIIVTTPDDKATQALCQKYSVDCLETEVFTEDGNKFNKGKGILLGQAHLRNDGWLIHMDADIILPHAFRQRLRQASLKTDCIYGADRFNIRGYEAFEWIKDKLRPQFQYRYMVTPPPMANQNLGARLLHAEFGYAPIGYFQMWHSSQTKRRYPVVSGSAEHSDVLFALQWPRDKRVLLPEVFVYHLESKDAAFGANWEGRKTARFEPNPNGKYVSRGDERFHPVAPNIGPYCPQPKPPAPHHHHWWEEKKK